MDEADTELPPALPKVVSDLASIDSNPHDYVSVSSADLLLPDQIESSSASSEETVVAEDLDYDRSIEKTVIAEDLDHDRSSTSEVTPADDWPVAQAPINELAQEQSWQVTLWGGPLTDADVGEALLFDVELADSYIAGVSASRPIVHLNDRVQLEGEVQALKHFGDQDHLEFTAGLGIRWQVAESVSVAFVDGLSLATETPELEEERADKANPLLNYFALELEVDIADDWALAARLHHRSGVFGLFNGVKRGSNAYLVGLRHTL